MGGTGEKFTHATTVVAGIASVVATLMSIVSIWLQAKNYRKPLQQRYVIRILLMVPIYAIASWTSMISHTAAAFLDPIRDIYEAFTIYTFFQLMVGYIGGERSLIIMMHGRAPVAHLWPINYVLPKVDISDPHTFLAMKRGILQYTWLKPILSLATIIMRAFNVYKEGYIGLTSGYLWTGVIYNISVTLSLYSLGLFWVCMHEDLKPFRPVPKFLCVKLIIFASYWQGFLLSILVWVGAIPDRVEGYTPDNLAVAIQDALICVEMPLFAAYHWHAFSWRDFYNKHRKSARMTLGHAIKDAFGARDLVEDTKITLRGENYGYRVFDSGDKIMAHEDSQSRLARLKDGMRYERGGKGKYWIRKPGDPANNPTPWVPTMPGDAANAIVQSSDDSPPNDTTPLLSNAGASSSSHHLDMDHGALEDTHIDSDDENLYVKARELEFGDWNYPVVSETETLAQRYGSPHGSQASLSPASPFTRASQMAPRPNLASRMGLRSSFQRAGDGSASSSSSRHVPRAPASQPAIATPPLPPSKPAHDPVPPAIQEEARNKPLPSPHDTSSSDDDAVSETAPLHHTVDEEAQNVWR